MDTKWVRLERTTEAYWKYGYYPAITGPSVFVMYTRDGWMLFPPGDVAALRNYMDRSDTDIGPFHSEEAAKVAARMMFPECFQE